MIEDKKYWEENENDIPEELKTKGWRTKRKKEIEAKKSVLELKKKETWEEIARKKKVGITQTRINETDTFIIKDIAGIIKELGITKWFTRHITYEYKNYCITN